MALSSKQYSILMACTQWREVAVYKKKLGLGLGLFHNPCIIKLIRLDWYISDKDEKKIVICLELTCSMEKSS